MSYNEIKGTIDKIATTFQAFKASNDERLSALEKGKGTAELEAKLDKMGDFMDRQGDIKERLDKIETRSLAEKAESLGLDSGSDKEYKAAYRTWMAKGDDKLNDIEKKALSVASDPDGGYTVTPVMADRIIKKIFETSPMRQVANVLTIGSDSAEFLVDNTQATSGGWTTEQGAITETATSTLGKKTIAIHTQFAEPRITQQLLDDSNLNPETFLADKIAEILTQTENTTFFTGDGVGKPRGILTYAAGTTWGTVEQISSKSTSGGTLDADDFINLFYSLKEPYQSNVSYLMQRAAVKKARLLKENTTNQYIWAPGLQAKAPDTILGSPVVQCNDMGVITTTDALAIACGDFDKAYQIIDRIGIRTLRDPYTAKPYVEFYTTKRVGGDVANFEAFKLLKMDA